MIKLALMATLKAKEGKEAEVEKFLRDTLPLVENEPATSTWYALRLDEETFLIFDTFTDEKGREEHLSGKVAKALEEKRNDLFSLNPVIEKLDIIAVKMPEVIQY
jgi:quinol monooxygenase YgiN